MESFFGINITDLSFKNFRLDILSISKEYTLLKPLVAIFGIKLKSKLYIALIWVEGPGAAELFIEFITFLKINVEHSGEDTCLIFGNISFKESSYSANRFSRSHCTKFSGATSLECLFANNSAIRSGQFMNSPSTKMLYSCLFSDLMYLYVSLFGKPSNIRLLI